MSQNTERTTDEIRLADYIRVLGKRKWLIIGGTLICMAAAAGVSLILPKVYEAKASLLVMPATFKPDLTPSMLSVYAYESLAKADDLKRAIIDSLGLIERGTTDPMRLATLDAMMKTEVIKETISIPSERERVVPSSPMINLYIRCPREEGPARIVNKWAELFVEKNSGLSSRETAGSYQFITNQYEQAKQNLEQAEDSLDAFNRRSALTSMKKELAAKTTKLTEYENTYLVQKLDLSTKESEHKALSRQLTLLQRNGMWIGSVDNEEEVESLDRARVNSGDIRWTVLTARNTLLTMERELLEFRNSHNLTLLKAKLDQRKSSLVGYEKELADIEILLATTDNVLSSVKPLELGNRTMPIMSNAFDANTLREIQSLEMGYNFFRPRKENLLSEIGNARAEVDSLEKQYNEGQRELEYLTRKVTLAQTTYDALSASYADLVNRVNTLQTEIDILRPGVEHSKRVLEELRREVNRLEARVSYTEIEQSRLQREITKYKSTFERFATLAENARIAKAETSGDVRIVAKAFEPEIPVAPKKKQNVMIAGVVGVMVSVAMAFLLEHMEESEG